MSRNLNTNFNKSKSPSAISRDRFFEVDLAVFEPASPLTKGVVLPHKLQAPAHITSVKQKKSPEET